MNLKTTILVLLLTLPIVARNRRHTNVIMPDLLPVSEMSSVSPQVSELLEAFQLSGMDHMLRADRLQLIGTAREFLGCRYGVGRRGPNRFDCSGFTGYVYEREGIMLGRSSRDQFHDGIAVASADELRPGDLVFFGRGGSADRINHVGMVVEPQDDGTFTFIHSSTSHGVIISRSTEPFWRTRFVGARRVIR